MPYLAVSLVLWATAGKSTTTEACETFIAAETYIKNLKLPLLVHVLRVIWRNMITFAHNFVIVIVVYVLVAPPAGWHLSEFPLGMVAVIANAVWLGLLLGLLCARFRDIPQIVASLVQVAFFLTPVIWNAENSSAAKPGLPSSTPTSISWKGYPPAAARPLRQRTVDGDRRRHGSGLAVHPPLLRALPLTRRLLGVAMALLRAENIVVDTRSTGYRAVHSRKRSCALPPVAPSRKANGPRRDPGAGSGVFRIPRR